MSKASLLASLLLVLSACADQVTGDPDATPLDGASSDSGSHDTGSQDSGSSDAGSADANPVDSGSMDTGPSDGGPSDVLPSVDAGSDASMADASSSDTGSPDAFVDAGPPDTGICTVNPNSCPNGELCLGEACSCIQTLHGSHYLRTNGTVVYWNGTLTVITSSGGADLSGVTEIFSGSAHGCALRSDTSVWCWPTSSRGNTNGQLGNGSTSSNVNSSDFFVATPVLSQGPVPLTGVAHLNTGASRGYAASNTCAVMQDSSLRCWGSPDSSGGGGGTLFNDGINGSRPFATDILAGPATLMSGVRSASLGTRHACVIRDGGTNSEVWCWGANVGGPLGQGNQNGSQYPVHVPLAGPADQLGAGADATCARVGTSIYCWGSNNSGQVGIGDRMATMNHDGCINYCKLTPTQVVDANGVGLTSAIDFNMGYLSACARRNDHSLWCWGRLTGASQSDWAIPAVLGGNALTNVAMYTTFSAGGFTEATLYLNRDNGLFLPGRQLSQTCP